MNLDKKQLKKLKEGILKFIKNDNLGYSNKAELQEELRYSYGAVTEALVELIYEDKIKKGKSDCGGDRFYLK